ncbi:serine protease [Bacteroidia bacterium]|nr:serine protease [Bacteroidia bacterium]
MYRLQLTDKGNPPYSIDRPEEFLSPKSIERRTKQGLSVDETDLPIDRAYLDAVTAAGADIRTSSKWVNTLVVNIPDAEVQSRVAALPFVKEMTKVWTGDLSLYEPVTTDSEEFRSANDEEPFSPGLYGDALVQIQLNNALPLHEKGYKGAGISIAVMDAGFSDVDKNPDYFNPDQILEVKNFSHQKGNPYRDSQGHGTYVLSCLLANRPFGMIGTAPEADFYLFKTEVNGEEFPVEEDYWVAALEYADSLGVDIVSTSLGYSVFDDPEMNHTWEELDGYTVPASRAASMAASKGMVLFHAAGNEGNKAWQKATVPSDAKNMLTVGSVNRDSVWSAFSSWGYIADGRIKPDIMAVGEQTCLVDPAGNIITSRGTSFATPVLAGMGACLWGALPHLTGLELMDLIKESSDRFTHPDEYFGYGIPNIYAAYLKGLSVGSPVIHPEETGLLYVDSVLNRLYFKYYNSSNPSRLTIYSYEGKVMAERNMLSHTTDLSFLPKGIYMALVTSGGKYYVCKFVIRN